MMMPLLRTAGLVMGLFGLGHYAVGQIEETRADPIMPLPRVIHQPIISDSTLLFSAPDVVWRCSYGSDVVGLEWFTADFALVKECTCRKETYRLVPFGGGYPGYHYVLADSLRMGSLVRTSDTTFTYSEVDGHRTVPFVFNASKVVKVDTSMYEDPYDISRMKMDVTRFVELKRSR